MGDTREYVQKMLEKENIKYDKDMLKRVVDYCELKYKDMKKSNSDMMTHVLGVAQQVASLRLDDTSVYGALLHGLLKCYDYNEKEVSELFGKELTEMINTVNKLSCLNIKTKEKLDSENLRNMFLAIAKDIRTVIIKLADRLYNMQNIANVTNEEVSHTMAKECLHVYAPIAHRLGMSQLKSELEDISFRILMPIEYNLVKTQIDEKKIEREEYIKDRINEVNKVLKKESIEANVYGRPKHFYSIFKKMKEKNCNADDLFDLLAIRIIVNSVKDCYSVLGIVHDMYKPMPGRFKDYIAVPKTNMYQSLHTTVFGEGGRPFEIQIRTWDMHKVADYGVAAHFSYKEKSCKISDSDKRLVWLRQTLEIQKEIIDTTENMKKMKMELFGEEVFVFTPKGDIKALPKGSTPIDFAYAIHQKVAEKMIGAKINSKMVPLNTKLENTDVVEVITSPKATGPSNDWIKIVKTTSARNKITGYIKKEGKEVNIQKGRDEFERLIKKQKVTKDTLLKEEYLKVMLKKSNYNSLEECYENIGFGSESAKKVINRLVEAYEDSIAPESKKAETKNTTANKSRQEDMVVVENIKNCKIQFAKCCLPIPGDEIIGYITNSNGVSIHRVDCPNLVALDVDKRAINVMWKQKIKENFTTKLSIKCNSRSNILTDVIQTFNGLKVNIIGMNSKLTDQKEMIVDVSFNIQDLQSLQNIIRSVKKIDSVYEVKRVR